MTEDKAMRARVAGKERVARRIVWALTMGDLELRCVKYDTYEVECHSDKGWVLVVQGTNALTLIKQAVSLPFVAGELAKKIAALDGKDSLPGA